MSYEDTWWTSLYVSLLTAYALSGWISTDVWNRSANPTGYGYVVDDGSYCHHEDGKPYDSGDPRAG